eukprot:CAMPEP_0171339892 /NCGR_PEP_ID=MMETSP0878-20121228/8226_1 /TAXON_ID=67004 /ORGANISM="Thalassiosira weissflogii, Strain CCMP1336" /LENGTH=52 /DNA_ID=CAMNT_0011841877 /DNA_START=252 /DNA_END=406 /DNA_ORIENTATION=-
MEWVVVEDGLVGEDPMLLFEGGSLVSMGVDDGDEPERLLDVAMSDLLLSTSS